MQRPYQDHLFVQIDAEACERTASGLYIPDWQPGEKDAKQAVVVAAPHGLSRERPLPFPGFDGHRYTYADLLDIPQPGETVYLRPNTFKPECEYPGHPGVFLVALDRVIATAGPDGLRPFQGLLLGEPVWGDDVRVRADGRRERVYVSTLDNKHFGMPCLDSQGKEVVAEADPLPIPFLLRVTHAGNPLRGQEDVVAVGDAVVCHRMLYAHHAVRQKDNEEASARWQWEPPAVLIDGREMVVMPRQCVLGARSEPVVNSAAHA